MVHARIDGLFLVSLALLAFMGINLFVDIQGGKADPLWFEEVAIQINTASAANAPSSDMPQNAAEESDDPPKEEDENPALIPPYDYYTITQGPHGFSYGHMAIDLAAGQGTPIKAPISGVVTDLFIDQWGNPNLVIENQRFRVTLLHGEYTVQIGDQVEQGQLVGKESNLGYTTDMQGRSCLNRNCGYHTHLNVFDKRKQENVNPMKWLGK